MFYKIIHANYAVCELNKHEIQLDWKNCNDFLFYKCNYSARKNDHSGLEYK